MGQINNSEKWCVGDKIIMFNSNYVVESIEGDNFVAYSPKWGKETGIVGDYKNCRIDFNNSINLHSFD